MAQIIENWADVVGRVDAVQAGEQRPAFACVRLHLEAVSTVPGFPNMFEGLVGQEIEILVPEAIVEALRLQPGIRLACRIRRGGVSGIFVHPEHVATLP